MSPLPPDRLRCTGALVAVVLALAGCSSATDDVPASPPTAEAEGAVDPDTESVPGPDVLSPPAERAAPLPEDELDPAPVGPAGAAEQASDDFPRWQGEPLQLVDARLISHEILDRLVLEFDGDLPSWQVLIQTGPLTEQPGRSEVHLAGDVVLEVRLVPATSIDRDAAEPMASYEGPSHLVARGAPVREALLTGDSSDILVWGIGVAGSPSYAVGTLGDPDRLVIDVFREAP